MSRFRLGCRSAVAPGESCIRRRQPLARRLLARRLSDQLTAGGADVAAAALAHRHGQAAVREDLREALTRASDGRSNGMPAASFSGSRLTFALIPFEQPRPAAARPRACRSRPSSITYSNVMRSRRLSGNRRHASSSSFERVLAVDRHQQVALLFGRRVQRDRQVRHQRLGREPLERGQHADGRERHAARAARARPCSSARIRSAFIVAS